MAQQTINVGTSPNDGLGDSLRTAFTKCNDNFEELFLRFRTSVPSTAVGVATDVAGMYAVNGTYFYYCFADYDGSSEIWRRVSGSSF